MIDAVIAAINAPGVFRVLLLSTVCWPLALAAASAGLHFYRLVKGAPSLLLWNRPWFAGLWMSAPLPALAAALTGGDPVVMEWLLMGSIWKTGGVRSILLAFMAVLWAAAGVHAHGYMAQKEGGESRPGTAVATRLFRFAALWQAAMAGCFLLVVAADIPGFYLGYALMTFSAWILVIHAGTDAARRGGFAYIVMAVIGEGLILAGLLWGAGVTETTLLEEMRSGLAASGFVLPVSALLWAGFGIKAGIAGLHVWLPMAHPVAPAPASAVLSGAMIKAGMIGWIYTLPVGLVALPTLGGVAVIAGLAGAFGAAVYGSVQRNPKVVLAYSSVSQMGMITSLFGIGLLDAGLWPVLLPVLLLFAVHHGLNKGALFLGTAVTDRPLGLPAGIVWIGLILPAVSLAGVFGSGLAVKWAVKSGLYDGGYLLVSFLLTLAAAGTSLLMIRAFFLQRRDQSTILDKKSEPASNRVVFGWLSCVIAAFFVPWWVGMTESIAAFPPLRELPGIVWPAAAGAALFWAVLHGVRSGGVLRKAARKTERLPEGDLWEIYARIAGRIARVADKPAAYFEYGFGRINRFWEKASAFAAGLLPALDRWEPFFRVWAGVLMVLVAGVLLFALAAFS